MDAHNPPGIAYLPGGGPAEPEASPARVEYVGGPRDGQRESRGDSPALIEVDGATYRRSVRCADDGALRYLVEEDPQVIAHQRWIRPC
jgi:hypothetical protein